MRYRLKDLPALLRNPVGRHALALGQLHAAFPVTAMIARAYRRTAIARTRVVTVVGSEGKSTTARAVAAALGNRLDDRLELNELALQPFQILRIPPGRRHAVIEAAVDAPGQMARLARMLRPDVCIATTIGTEHIQAFGSTDAILAEKSLMLRALPPVGVAVLNGDDPSIASMAALTRARVITYGHGERNEVRAVEVVPEWPRSTRIVAKIADRVWHVVCPGIDHGVAYAAMAALAVAHGEGVPLEQACSRLEALPPPSGRMEVVTLGNGAVLLCDTQHAGLAGTYRALEVLERFPGRRKLAVLGSLHEIREDAREAYRQVGARLAAVASRAFFVCESSEYGKCYRVGACGAGLASDRITLATRDVAGVIALLRAELRDGDVVLIRGRTYQRLERIALALAGKPVRCDLPVCRVAALECRACRMLSRGWQGRRPVF